LAQEHPLPPGGKLETEKHCTRTRESLIISQSVGGPTGSEQAVIVMEAQQAYKTSLT